MGILTKRLKVSDFQRAFKELVLPKVLTLGRRNAHRTRWVLAFATVSFLHNQVNSGLSTPVNFRTKRAIEPGLFADKKKQPSCDGCFLCIPENCDCSVDADQIEVVETVIKPHLF